MTTLQAPSKWEPYRAGILARTSQPRLGSGTSRSVRRTIKGENSVKKMFFLVAGFAALIAGAYSSSYLFAQGGGAATAPAATSGTKIAVVNIGEVFNKYKRAQAM